MFSTFTSNQLHPHNPGSDADSDDDLFESSPINRMFQSSINVGSAASQKSKRRQKYSDQQNRNNRNDIDDDQISIASNESGWSITSDDILQELKSRSRPKIVHRAPAAPVNKKSDRINSDSDEKKQQHTGNIQKEAPTQHLVSKAPPLPPAMAAVKRKEEAQKRKLSKWAVLRQKVRKNSSMNVINVGMRAKMRAVVTAAKHADALSKIEDMQQRETRRTQATSPSTNSSSNHVQFVGYADDVASSTSSTSTTYAPLPLSMSPPCTSSYETSYERTPELPQNGRPILAFGTYGTQYHSTFSSPQNRQSTQERETKRNQRNQRNPKYPRYNQRSQRHQRRVVKEEEGQLVRPVRGTYGVGIGNASRNSQQTTSGFVNFNTKKEYYPRNLPKKGYLSPNEKAAELWARDQHLLLRQESLRNERRNDSRRSNSRRNDSRRNDSRRNVISRNDSRNERRRRNDEQEIIHSLSSSAYENELQTTQVLNNSNKGSMNEGSQGIEKGVLQGMQDDLYLQSSMFTEEGLARYKTQKKAAIVLQKIYRGLSDRKHVKILMKWRKAEQEVVERKRQEDMEKMLLLQEEEEKRLLLLMKEEEEKERLRQKECRRLEVQKKQLRMDEDWAR